MTTDTPGDVRPLRRRTRQRLLAAAALLLAGCGGDVLIGDESLYPLWIPTAVVVTDIDADGRPDIVASAYVSPSLGVFEGRIQVRRQISAGVFTAATEYAVGNTPWALKVHDLDGDGRQDLVVGEPDQIWDGVRRPGRVWWLKQDPVRPGDFQPPALLAEGYNVYDVDVADLTADGIPDIAFGDARTGSHEVWVLPQNAVPRGSFGTLQSVMTPGPVSRLVARDVNKDGLIDLTTAYTSAVRPDFSYDISLGLNLRGPVGFGGTLPLTTFAYGRADHLAVADFNFDGNVDAAAYFSRFDERAVPTIRVLPQVSANTWGTPIDTPLPVDTVKGRDGQAVADINDDGRPDFVFVGSYPEGTTPDGFSIIRSDLSVLLQGSDGHFLRSATYPMPISATRVGAGDVDDDGRQDLVVYGTTVLLGGGNADQLLLLRQSSTGTFPTVVTLP